MVAFGITVLGLFHMRFQIFVSVAVVIYLAVILSYLVVHSHPGAGYHLDATYYER